MDTYQLKSVLLLLFTLTVNIVYGQNDQNKVWDKNSPLQWSDFRGAYNPNDAQVSHANAVCGELYTYDCKQVNGAYLCTFNVRSMMDRSRSASKPDEQTPALLKHEQTHFDISEFFARKLLVAFNTQTYTSEYKNEILKLRHQLSIQRNLMENKYDEETEHSLNTKMQRKWEFYAADLLDKDYTLDEAIKKEP